MNKKCNKCGQDNPVPPFGESNQWWRWQANKYYANGGLHICRECADAYQYKYRRSREGWARITYLTQCKSSKARKHPAPDYTVDEFTLWAFAQPDFEALYKNWSASGFLTDLRPSADRLNDFAPYTLDEIRLITFRENHAAGVSGEKAQRAYSKNNLKQGKEVEQFAVDGKYIATYRSAGAASKITGIDTSFICRCCNGKCQTAGGYVWRRPSEE
jgi:hypothetical protein